MCPNSMKADRRQRGFVAKQRAPATPSHGTAWTRVSCLTNSNVPSLVGQIVTRLAPTFLRFGSFEIFKATDDRTGRAGPSVGNDALRLQMLEYAVSRFFPMAAAAGPEGSKARYLAM